MSLIAIGSMGQEYEVFSQQEANQSSRQAKRDAADDRAVNRTYREIIGIFTHAPVGEVSRVLFHRGATPDVRRESRAIAEELIAARPNWRGVLKKYKTTIALIGEEQADKEERDLYWKEKFAEMDASSRRERERHEEARAASDARLEKTRPRWWLELQGLDS